jgi:site-specific DNA-adenine methylase
MSLIDDILLNAISNLEEEIIDLNKELEGLKFTIKNKEDKVREIQAEYQRLCNHPAKQQFLVSVLPGDYGQVSESTYQIQCLKCSKILDTTTKLGRHA